MDKQKLQQDINELKAKLAEMEAELNKPEPVINYWQPTKGEKFFYMDPWGNYTHTTAKYNTTERYRVFKTEQQAQAYAEYVKAEETLKAEIARLNEGWWPDWNVISNGNYVVEFNSDDDYLKLSCYTFTKNQPNFMYLKSRELAYQLIKTHSKELTTYLTY